MKSYKFKTNINCGNCIKSVTPFLDELKDAEWNVDTNDKRKVLEVKTNSLTEKEIIDKVHQETGMSCVKGSAHLPAGYTADILD